MQDVSSKNIKVSIIIPVYNRENVILNTLDSVYNQRHRPLELIIVNDGSSDNSEKIILDWKDKKISPEFHVHYSFQKNRGAPAARNHGLRMAKGDYIQFLDSDDLLRPQKITEQISQLTKINGEVAVCDYIEIDAKDDSIKKIRNNGNLWFKMAKGGSLSIFTPLFKISFIRKGLIWNESLKRNQDVDFILKLMLLTKKYVYTPGYWCLYSQHGHTRISDLYLSTTPEFLKRIKSLAIFCLKNYKLIPKKNYIYCIVGLIFLLKNWLFYHPKSFIRKHFPFIIELKNTRRLK